MSAKHFDGTLCVGGGFNPPQFENMGECPLCARDTDDWATEQAAMSLRMIGEKHSSAEAATLATELRAIHRRISNLTWAKKGGAK